MKTSPEVEAAWKELSDAGINPDMGYEDMTPQQRLLWSRHMKTISTFVLEHTGADELEQIIEQIAREGRGFQE